MTTLPDSILTEQHLLARADIGRREHTAEQLEAARVRIRETMQAAGGDDLDALDPLKVAERLIAADVAAKVRGAGTVKRSGLYLAAALDIREEGRSDRGSVPTQDAPAGDTGGKKGRKAKAPKAPRKPKAALSYLGRLCAGRVSTWPIAEGVTDEALLARLCEHGYAGHPRTEAERGFVRLDDPELSLGADVRPQQLDRYHLLALVRRECRCPTRTIRARAVSRATREARAEGHAEPIASRVADAIEEARSAWYASATPETTVYPVVYDSAARTVSLHGGGAGEIERMVLALSGLVGDRRDLPLVDEDTRRTRTDLRHPDGGEGASKPKQDLMLWLVGMALGGVSTARTEAGDLVTWWPESSVDLHRPRGEDKALKARVSGAPTSGLALGAALADGASVIGIGLGLTVGERRYTVTVDESGPHGWRLPTETKVDGTAEGTDAAILERLRLLAEGEAALEVVISRFLAEYQDAGTWRQRCSAWRRAVGVVLAVRFRDVFPEQFPGGQLTLASVAVSDERVGA